MCKWLPNSMNIDPLDPRCQAEAGLGLGLLDPHCGRVADHEMQPLRP